MSLPPDVLARRIVAARILRGLDQTEVGDLMGEDGYGKHDVARLERQDPKAPVLNAGRRVALAEILQVPEEWFVVPDDQLFDDIDELQLDRIEQKLDRVVEAMPNLAQLDKDVTALAAHVRRISLATRAAGEAQARQGQAPDSPAREDPRAPAGPGRSRRSGARRSAAS